MKQEMMRWQWHQLDHIQIICTGLTPGKQACLQLDTQFFTGWMLFQSSQQSKTTEGMSNNVVVFCYNQVKKL